MVETFVAAGTIGVSEERNLELFELTEKSFQDGKNSEDFLQRLTKIPKTISEAMLIGMYFVNTQNYVSRLLEEDDEKRAHPEPLQDVSLGEILARRRETEEYIKEAEKCQKNKQKQK